MLVMVTGEAMGKEYFKRYLSLFRVFYNNFFFHLQNLMIVGIDSYHEKSKKGSSVAGFVASINATISRLAQMRVVLLLRSCFTRSDFVVIIPLIPHCLLFCISILLFLLTGNQI